MSNEGEFSQMSKSEYEEKIEIEPGLIKLHNGKEVTELLLSPNNKYAVTYSEDDKSICGWQLDQPFEQSENESYRLKPFKFDCSINVEGDLVAVSNNRLAAISLYRKSIEIINLATTKKIELNFYPYRCRPFEECRFCNNGDFLIVADDYECQYIFKFSFTRNNLQSWKINNSIICGAPKDIERCQISEEKFWLLDNCRSLTQWNLNTLVFEKQYQLGWIEQTHFSRFMGESFCIFNKNSTLLAVYLYPFIYVYLTETSVLLSQCQLKGIQHFEFISSVEGERLLLFFYDNLEIRDPYNLQHVISNKTIANFYEELLELLNEETLTKLMQSVEFKTLMDKKIFFISNRCLWVKEVSDEQWIKYLREKLEDYNEIRGLPNKFQIQNLLERFLNENMDSTTELLETKSYDGSLVKWEVSDNEKEIVINAWKFDTDAWKSVNSVEFDKFKKVHYKLEGDDENRGAPISKVYSCTLLNNTDLAMITNFGLFIWSICQKVEKDEIRLQYYMFGRKISGIEEILLDKIPKYSKYSLLLPDFVFLIMNYEQPWTKDRRCLFKELLEDYIEDKPLLLYWQELLNCFLCLKNYSIIGELCSKICKKMEDVKILLKLYGWSILRCCLECKSYSAIEELCSKLYKEMEDDNFLPNIQLLDIFTFSFIELTQFPRIIKKFLSYVLFVHSTNNFEEINYFFSDPHLKSNLKYLQPYFDSNIKRLDKLYDIVTKIQDNNWDEIIEKPFLSNSLLKIIHIDKTEIESKTIEEKIQQITDNENNIIQKLENNEKIIQELKKILLKE
ncbi:20387_t:CDS:2, partial [Gigaspora margarita]